MPTALLPYSCRGSVIEGTESLSPDSDTPHQSSCRTTATCRRSAKTRCRPPRARSQHLHARLDQSCTTARTTTIFNLSFEIPTMDAVQMFLVIFLALFFICGIIAPACEKAREREVRRQARNEDLIRFRRERRERERESSTGRRPTELDRSPLGPRRGGPSVRSGRSSSRPACSPALWSTATRSGPLPCC